MIIVPQSVELTYADSIEQIEDAARTCWLSEGRKGPGTAAEMVKELFQRKHLPMIEFASYTFRIVTNIAIARELTRHRHCSFAQESTRYVNYNNKGFVACYDGQPTEIMINAWKSSFKAYEAAVQNGLPIEEARMMLPLVTKTSLTVKANLREWFHIFDQRMKGTTGKPARMMQNLATMIHDKIMSKLEEEAVSALFKGRE